MENNFETKSILDEYEIEEIENQIHYDMHIRLR